RGLVLVRNPRFRVWNPAAQPGGYPERIVWTFYSSGASKTWDAGTAAAVRAVRLRRADYMNDAATAAAALGRAGYVSQLHISPAFATIYLVFNTRVPPFDNVNARRAVNYAIDRTHLVGLTPGQARTCQVLPPNLTGYVRFCPFRLDLPRARRLVTASGTAGRTVTVLARRDTGA